MSLTAENLSVSLGRREVLSGVSFEARRGELLVVVGPNGAGKTSLLKAIAGLAPSAGRLDWDGTPLGAMSASARAKTLAYLPQGHVAHWPLAARDVVAIGRAPFASSLARLTASDREAVDRAIAAVGATPFADRPVTELSGGERARIMLARALAVGAPLLLADEPVASLDPAHQLGVMDLLAAQAKEGRLVIAVSHDLLLAARYADRILVLTGGRAVAFGAPRETLTAALLKQIFQVESVRLDAPGVSLDIPWSVDRG
ncbi:MAG TPA: ABC transporter ATP-binding protein [Hyphomicrobiales bacterium]|jgi:iron complex transport system ATP-binding protein